MINENFTIVQEERFIEATRDSGYKSTSNAISENADNAFQAGANNFFVHFISKAPTGKKQSPIVLEVVCVDDGSGMSPSVLRNALRFGG
ncbi:MAG: ATP-binding protein, partial [Phycisphaerales bacterium]